LNDNRFRQWTRRGLALLAGSGVASALALLDPTNAGADKKHKKKKRCRLTGEVCSPDKRCCKSRRFRLRCDRTVPPDSDAFRCCRPEGFPTSTAGIRVCCSREAYKFPDGHLECASCAGRKCDAANPCCGGMGCKDGLCGGCQDRAGICVTDADCCFTACHDGVCISKEGSRCARDEDCLSCRDNPALCGGACAGGLCKV
jgi:hypothetical protein